MTRAGQPKAKVITSTAAMVKVVLVAEVEFPPCTYKVLKSAKEGTSPLSRQAGEMRGCYYLFLQN